MRLNDVVVATPHVPPERLPRRAVRGLGGAQPPISPSHQDTLLVQFLVAPQIAKEREKLPKPIIPGPPMQEVRYSISGRTKWRPVGIYTDGIKTYIKMPDTIGYIEAPVLYLLRGRQRVLVNYRIHNDLYVIDTVLDRAEMTIGKERITLTRRS